MAAFESKSLGWQLQQGGQRLAEGWESFWAGTPLSVPLLEKVPRWVETVLVWLTDHAWIGGLVALGWLTWLLWPWLREWPRPALSFPFAVPPAPPAPPPSTTAWLRRAEEWAQEGQYRQACRALYLALLQRLEDRHILPQEKSRTDGEYLQILQALPGMEHSRLVIATHEELHFRDTPASEDLFLRCRRALQGGTTP